MKVLKLCYLYSIFVLLLACKSNDDKAVEPVLPVNKLLYSWSFSEVNPLHDLAELTSNVSVVTDPLDATNKVMQVILPKGEYRTEASVGATSPHYFYIDKSTDFTNGDEIWAGVRILKYKEPLGGVNTNASIFQIGPLHRTIDTKNGSGHYQLILSTKTDKWKWREFTSSCNPGYYNDTISTPKYGEWERFVLHCRFRSNNTGLMEVWKNDVKIYSAARQNGVEYARTRIKWGIYLGAGNVDHETIKCYFDDVKIGGANASYDDVSNR
jgi:hypothetical protein